MRPPPSFLQGFGMLSVTTMGVRVKVLDRGLFLGFLAFRGLKGWICRGLGFVLLRVLTGGVRGGKLGNLTKASGTLGSSTEY